MNGCEEVWDGPWVGLGGKLFDQLFETFLMCIFKGHWQVHSTEICIGYIVKMFKCLEAHWWYFHKPSNTPHHILTAKLLCHLSDLLTNSLIYSGTLLESWDYLPILMLRLWNYTVRHPGHHQIYVLEFGTFSHTLLHTLPQFTCCFHSSWAIWSVFSIF